MRKLQQRIETGLSKRALWEVLADFAGVQKWAPGMRRSALVGDQESGVGMQRAMRHRLGFKIVEIVTAWSEGNGYEFDLLKAPFPMRNVHETWTLESVRGGGTRITTTVTYDMGLGVVGASLDALLVRFMVAREMRNGLRALTAYTDLISRVKEMPAPVTVQTVMEAKTGRQVSG